MSKTAYLIIAAVVAIVAGVYYFLVYKKPTVITPEDNKVIPGACIDVQGRSIECTGFYEPIGSDAPPVSPIYNSTIGLIGTSSRPEPEITTNPALIRGADQLQGRDPNLVEGYNYNFTKGLDAFGVQVHKYFQDRQTGAIYTYPMQDGQPYAWENVKAQYWNWTGTYDPAYGGNLGGHDIFMPESVPIGTIDQKSGIFGGN